MFSKILLLLVIGGITASLILYAGHLVLSGSPGLALLPVGVILVAAFSYAYVSSNKKDDESL